MNRTARPLESEIKVVQSASPWKQYELWAFRIVFLYFAIQCLPLDWKYYQQLSHFNISAFQDWFQLTRYYPQFISTDSVARWGIASYANWAIVLFIAVLLAVAWSGLADKQRQYNDLYYLLRVMLRYRLAIGIIGYGIIKAVPLQFPQPSLSDLHTAYGDFLPWKVYYLTTGFGKANYQQTIGLLEIIGGLLLLHRRTATPGAILILLLLSNIVVANFAYQLGNHVYASYLLVLTLAFLWYDTPRLISLLVRNKFTRAVVHNGYTPGRRYLFIRKILKGGVAVFILLLASTAIYSKADDRWPYPRVGGLHGAEGFYNVDEYSVNGKKLPYSLTDSTRWRDVVFEKWNTISVRRGQSAPVDFSVPVVTDDRQRPYEQEGNGGRYFYRYTVDTVSQTLHWYDPYLRSEATYQYAAPRSDALVLRGVNEQQDSVRILLSRQNRKQLLIEGRRDTKKKF